MVVVFRYLLSYVRELHDGTNEDNLHSFCLCPLLTFLFHSEAYVGNDGGWLQEIN